MINTIHVSNNVQIRLLMKAQQESANFIYSLIEKNGKLPFLFSDRTRIHNFLINRLKQTNLNKKNLSALEFGVYKGKSGKRFARGLKNFTFYGFDSFQGLPEVFSSADSDTKFKLGGKPPKFMPKNYKIINGLIEETLDIFLLKNLDIEIKFIHLDLDVFSSTKFVLNSLYNKISSNTYILFDEIFGNPFWQMNEFKALNDVFEECEYEWLAFGPNQGLIKIK